jgi:fibro-slime domain-containing protein
MNSRYLSFIRTTSALSLAFISSIAIFSLSTSQNVRANSDSNSSLPDTITLTGTIRDFTIEHPDFATPENNTTYNNVVNIVQNYLGIDGKPIFRNHTHTVSTQANFDRWFRDVACNSSDTSVCNQSKTHSITLAKDSQTGNYVYENRNFFPIDNELFGNATSTHNDRFTYEINSQFTYRQGQVFQFGTNGSLWVFINGKLVVDIGGINNNMGTGNNQGKGTVNLDDLQLTEGQAYDIAIFYAARQTESSALRIETWIAESSANDTSSTNTSNTSPQIFWD